MAVKKTAKAKKEKKVPEVIVEVEHPSDNDIVSLSEKDLLNKLSERLSFFDAEMILEAAMMSAGVMRRPAADIRNGFKKKEARNICLALIKKGGPAFAVGAAVYKEVVG